MSAPGGASRATADRRGAVPPRLDRAKLLAARLRAADARPYLATALYALAVVVSDGVPTMGVDRHWRCYANPRFVAARGVEELAAVWVHEVTHLLRDHHGRGERLPPEYAGNPLRLNLAADCEINDDLAGDGLALPDGAVLPADVGLHPGGLFEEYARALPAYETVGWYECGSGAHGRRAPWEVGVPGDVSPMEAAAIRRHTAIAIRERGVGRGGGAGGWRRWADGELASTVDWRRLLRGAVRGAMGTAGGAVDYTYRRPSRRAPAVPGVLLPALYQPVPRVVVVIDTSGSVSDTDLAAALGEVTGVLRAVGLRGDRVTVLCCDAGAYAARHVSAAGQVELYGGGGTDLRAGLSAAARYRPDSTVVLTDGQTPWPDAAPPFRTVVGLLVPRARASAEDLAGAGVRVPGWARTVVLPV